MQHVSRPPQSPAVLRSPEMQKSRQEMQRFMSLERDRREQTSVPQVGVPADHPPLVAALSALTRGHCAFCEASDDLLAHRFRPAGNLKQSERKDAHLFYVWLADAWQNLFPICAGCVPDDPVFPVEGERGRLPTPQQVNRYVKDGTGVWSAMPQEANLLIDPSKEGVYDRHLKPRLDGTLIALTSRAAATVRNFDLNREDRRHQREVAYTQRFDRLRELLSGPRTKKARSGADWSALFDFRGMEFGGTWLLLLKRVARRIDFPGDVAIPSRRADMAEAFRQLPNAKSLDSALVEIGREDPRLIPVDAETPGGRRLRADLRVIEVERFKGLERMRLEIPSPQSAADGRRRAPALVVLGENATGKSSLLEAVALTLSTDEARRALDLDWGEMPLDPTQMGLEGGSSAPTASVSLEFDGGLSATLSISRGEGTVRSDFGSERAAVFAYGAFRRFAADAPAPSSSRHVRNLFDATSLADPEPWLRSLSPSSFAMVVRTLRDLLSIEGDFEVIQRTGRSRELRMVTALAEPGGTIRHSRTPLRAVSSGYRSMLGMLCDVLRGLLVPLEAEGASSFENARGVVLVDEIEAHLHPRWKVQVMTSLRTALPGVTFVVTTHDPLCLRGMSSGEITVLQRVASSEPGVESAMPIVVERMSGLPDAEDLGLEQLLTSDFFQLFSSNDAASDRKMARIADLMALRDGPDEMSEEDRSVLEEFERDIASALPVGSSEVHRLVQSTVADYLGQRREASSARLAELTGEARKGILDALERI